MKTKHTIEISGHELTKFLIEKLGLPTHVINAELTGVLVDVGGFPGKIQQVSSVKLTWESGVERGWGPNDR